mmetsp:Transcript_17215/g.14000  ORF Transcript_17215/g.14000 Transcript_17215/m.14000 type:complete len:191 (-) Transcript_17215:138-710(-)
MAGRVRSLLALALALAFVWTVGNACLGTVALVTAKLWQATAQRPLVARQGGRDWKAGNVQKRVDPGMGRPKKGLGAPVNFAKAAKAGKDSPKIEPPEIKREVPLVFNGKQVGSLNGTLDMYKVDIWAGAHPVWQGKKGKVVLDASSLTKFQEKFGAGADYFGDLGMDQLKENQRLKEELEERKKKGLKVY